MRLPYLILTLFICSSLFAQKEGQSFCGEFDSADYFPVTIENKTIVWYDTHYKESIVGKKIIDGKEYIEFAQAWEAGNTEDLFLRVEGNQVLQYEECCETDTVRYDQSFEKNTVWRTADKKTTYVITTFEGTLKTPYCSYKNLMIISGDFGDYFFHFYYKKGYGYVGATVDDGLISFVLPK